MRILFSLLVFFALTIACKRDNNSELEVQKEATFYLDNNNLKLLKRMEKEVADNGNRQKEVAFLNSLKILLFKRINAKSSPENLKNYKNAIYGFANDTLQATPKIEFKLKDEQIQNDSSSFYIYYQDILLFEKNLLELALINLSGSCTWYSSYLPVNKTKDTVAVNEEYSIAVTPDLYFPRRVDVQPDSITVFKKGEKMIIPFRTEIVGGILLLRFSPNEAGKYVIKGAVKIKSLYNDFYRSHRFTDSVFVRVI